MFWVVTVARERCDLPTSAGHEPETLNLAMSLMVPHNDNDPARDAGAPTGDTGKRLIFTLKQVGPWENLFHLSHSPTPFSVFPHIRVHGVHIPKSWPWDSWWVRFKELPGPDTPARFGSGSSKSWQMQAPRVFHGWNVLRALIIVKRARHTPSG